MQDKYDEALAAFRAAVEKEPEMSDAWYGIGVAEMEKKAGAVEAAGEAPSKVKMVQMQMEQLADESKVRLERKDEELMRTMHSVVELQRKLAITDAPNVRSFLGRRFGRPQPLTAVRQESVLRGWLFYPLGSARDASAGDSLVLTK